MLPQSDVGDECTCSNCKPPAMLTVTVAELDGKVLWKGLVRAADVAFSGGITRPRTCIIRTPMLDAMSVLTARGVKLDAN